MIMFCSEFVARHTFVSHLSFSESARTTSRQLQHTHSGHYQQHRLLPAVRYATFYGSSTNPRRVPSKNGRHKSTPRRSSGPLPPGARAPALGYTFRPTPNCTLSDPSQKVLFGRPFAKFWSLNPVEMDTFLA